VQVVWPSWLLACRDKQTQLRADDYLVPPATLATLITKGRDAYPAAAAASAPASRKPPEPEGRVRFSVAPRSFESGGIHRMDSLLLHLLARTSRILSPKPQRR
jgi:hypothetical protein